MQHAVVRILRRSVAIVFFLYLCAANASAQVPDATIRRLAEIRVALAEGDFLTESRQIDSAEHKRRAAPLNKEQADLLHEVRSHPRDAQRSAMQEVQGLARTRLSVLGPQWRKQLEELAAGRTQRDRALRAAARTDAEAALAPQRKRLALQRQLERQEITRERFEAEDKKALDEIMALRGKYAAEGSFYARIFDTRLEFLTANISKAPSAAPAKTIAQATEPVRQAAAPPVTAPSGFWAAAPVLAFLFAAATTVLPVLALLGLGLWLFLLTRPKAKDASTPPLSTTHGTAEFSPPTTSVSDAAAGEKGIFLGQSSGLDAYNRVLTVPGVPVWTAPESHTLIVAPTRSGKGARVIVPTLLRYSGSALVIDPKGENAVITAKARRDQLGQQVHVINPWNEHAALFAAAGFQTATFNPLDQIDRNDPNAVSIARRLAGTICPIQPDGKNRFWEGSAAGILTAVFLWLADKPEPKTLGRARELTTLSATEFEKLLVRMSVTDAFGGAIRENASPFIGMKSDAYYDIMATLAENMRFVSDPIIKASTETSTFETADLLRGSTTVYVVIPADRIDANRVWLRMLLSASMNSLKRLSKTERAGRRCLFLIDEFPALGRLDDIPSDIVMMAGYGLDLALIVQDLSQIKSHYGPERDTIIGNCRYKWFCNVNDLETAKWLSETLGKKTVATTTTSDSETSGTRSQSEGRSTSHGETGRSLLNPDEILNLGRDAAIVLQPQGRPHLLRTIDYWNLTRAFAPLRAEYPGMFWDPPLNYAENPYADSSQDENDGDHGAGDKGGNTRSARSPFSRGGLTPVEAREILGVGSKATRKEIERAYLELVKRVHPDRGGSKVFTQQLNLAKEVLLGK